MKKKRMLVLLAVVICLLGLIAGILSSPGKKKLQVSFDMNWKEAASNPESIEVKTGDTYGQLPQIAEDIRDGYSFGGWYLDADCDGEEVTAETVVTAEEDHTLYAKWVGDEITVSFDLQGGNINGISTVEDVVVTVGNVYSMMAIPEDPEWDNHSFLGWYYDPEGTDGPVLTSTKVVKTEDHTLYAVWSEYKLFYDFEQDTDAEVFSVATNLQCGIADYNGSKQLKITNPGTDKPEGTMLMWLPLKTGTRVTMDVTFDGALPAELARMSIFCYGVNESGVAMTEGLIDINESETHRRWYHGNGYRAMQKNGTWYYGDEGSWTKGNTCKFEMIIMEDCAGLYMNFCLGSELTQAQFEKNAIYIDNIEFTPNYYRILEDGMMGSSPYGATDGGIYFTMKDNGLPYGADWDVYYGATTADNIKIIRNGKVYRVAEVGCDNICKFSATDYYLRLEEYTIGVAAPISTDDMFIVEGDFAYGKRTLSIKKAYIYHDGTQWVVVDQLPEELAPASEKASDMPDPYEGILRSHEGGATDGGIHFRLSDNGLPFGKDWDVYYDATTADNIKIIRDGKVYRAAQVGCDNICKFDDDSYYLRLESYTIGGYAPFSKADIYIIEGDFVYEESTLHINKTYLYHNGIEWVFATKLPAHLAPETEEPAQPEVIADGMMGASINGATDQGIYFTMKDNGLPYGDWSIYYDATSANNIKIIRGGKVYAAAEVGCDNICKFSATDYYLRLENYTIGGYAPFSTQDIFIVEGDFTYEESTLSIVKTYIYHDGTAWVFAAELPENLKPETEEPTVPDENTDGMISPSVNGATDNGIYFTMKNNGLPYGDWNVYYDAASANSIKIIRDGKVYAAAQVGCDNICKFTATDYYLRLESHTIGDYAPISTQDIFIVEGDFTYEESTLSIVKTYIYHDGTAWVFAAELPENLKPETEEPTVPGENTDGMMSSSANGATDSGIYFTMKDNGLPYGDWNVYYDATSADNIKIIRNGVVYSAAQVGCDNICKFGATDYYLKLENYTIGDYAPFTTQDIFIVEGDFTYEESTLSIVKTYIYHDGTAWVFAAELPENLKPDGGEDTPTDTPWPFNFETGSVSTDIFKLRDSDLSMTVEEFGGSKQLRLKPTVANGKHWLWLDQDLKAGTVITMDVTFQRKLGAGAMGLYLYGAKENGDPITNGTVSDTVPQVWFNGQGVNADFTDDKTNTQTVTFTVYEDCHGIAFELRFGNKLPNLIYLDNIALKDGSGDGPELGNGMGVLTAHNAGVNISGNTITGIYATAAATNATFDPAWAVEYTPAAAENYKLIRGGATYNVGVPGNGTIVLFSQTELYLKQEGHTFGDGTLLPIRNGDILVVEGQWNCIQNASSTVEITTTYILIGDGTATFSATNPSGGQGEPGTNSVGVLSAHNGGVSISNNAITGIHVTGAATNAKFNSNWSVEYTPGSAANYRLIRNGVTYDLGVPGAGTIVMFGQTEFYLKLENWLIGDVYPIRGGDVLVVEGEWSCKQDASSVINISKTYVLFTDDSASFSDTEPGSED